LGKYGASSENATITFDVGKAGVDISSTQVNTAPVVRDYALFTTMGAIERSIDGIRLNPSNPTTILDSDTAEIVANTNSMNAWICNLGKGTGELGADYNANYIAKYGKYLQIRIMEEVLDTTTKTTIGVYNNYTVADKNTRIMELARAIPNLGIVNDTTLSSKIKDVVLQEIIGSTAITRSTQAISVQEKYTWEIDPSNIRYGVGEVVYNMSVVTATKSDGTDYMENGSVVNIVDTVGTAQKLYDASDNPILVIMQNKYNENVLVHAREGQELTIPDTDIKYSVGEIVYTTEYQTVPATKKSGEVCTDTGGNVVMIADTYSTAELLYYPDGMPILVTKDINGTDVQVHAVDGDEFILNGAGIPNLGNINYERVLDANDNGIIDNSVYTNAVLYGYTYSTDVDSIVDAMLQWGSSMPKVDSREILSIDSTKYYSPITEPTQGKLMDIEHMNYENYNSAIVYNSQFAFPWLLGLSIQSKSNLEIDVYIRARKTYLDGLQFNTVTQVLKLGTMHTDSSEDFCWDGEVEDETEVDYDTLVANSRMWDICLEFGELLPEVTIADILPNSDAYIDDNGVLQYSITDIDFTREKFKDYKYIYYMQTQGMTPPSSDGKVMTEVVEGQDTLSQTQGYYQSGYDRYLSTDKLTGTAGDNREVTFSQNLIVYNDQNSQEDYIEIIFDVKNKHQVSDSTFKFYIEQYPLTQNEED
ncbi:MAG: hypothetical protein IKC79_00355, partial [Clostridia bacterium]|nr:hypothetical protein [Clostridia bacterium]